MRNLTPYRPGWSEQRGPMAEARVVSLWLKNLSPNTVRSYKRSLRVFEEFLEPDDDGLTWSSAHLDDVIEWLDDLSSHHPPSTAKVRLAAVKSLFNFAQRIGFLQFNPAAAVRGPRVEQRLDRVIAESDVLALIRGAGTDGYMPHRNWTLCALLYYGGLRLSEALNATWEDCETRPGGVGQLSVVGKGQRRRTVLIHPDVWSRAKASRVIESVFLVPNRWGGRLSARSARGIVYRLSKELLGRRIRPHELRHAHATHAMERGASLTLVRSTLGHKSIQTTSCYLHARPADSSGLWLPT